MSTATEQQQRPANVVVPATKADPKPKQIGGKVKRALDLMVFGDEKTALHTSGMTRAQSRIVVAARE
ncbi:MAG: hypothetical protein IPK23_15050 [Rhizobiales bacterium]|nr:hypothetical protein [Hyphomicrobiales bacterium]